MQSILPNTWRHAFEDIGHGLKEKWDKAKGATRSLLMRNRRRSADTGALAEWSRDRSLNSASWWSGPNVDVAESAKEIRVTARLPGLDKDAFSIDLDGRFLTLRAERRAEEEKRGRGYVYHSRSYGAYLRTIPLPGEVDGSGAKAEYRSGELVVTLPKAKATSSRRVEIG